MTSFYSYEELNGLGFKSIGQNVLISRKASIYGAENIRIGNNVRIDDFCILSGNITIGNYIHVAAYSALYAGSAGIVLNDFCNISSRVCIYAVSDDYSGETMTNPMVDDKYKNVTEQQVIIGKHAIIGTGSTVLPGACVSEGTAVGAMSLIKETTKPWGMYAGVPARLMKERKKGALALERRFLDESKAD